MAAVCFFTPVYICRYTLKEEDWRRRELEPIIYNKGEERMMIT